MTYQFPPMDIFEKALNTLDEEDIAEIRNEYLYDVFISELIMNLEDYKYSTPIFEFSPKKVKTGTERTSNNTDFPRINSDEIKKCDLNKAIKRATIDKNVASSSFTNVANTDLNNISYNINGKAA